MFFIQPNKTYEFTIILEKKKTQKNSLIIFYLNSKVEIFKVNNIFHFSINGKKQTKDEINKNYDHINIEKMDKNLDFRIENYFHLNWTENNMINMDFKDEKLLEYLCGLCEGRIIFKF